MYNMVYSFEILKCFACMSLYVMEIVGTCEVKQVVDEFEYYPWDRNIGSVDESCVSKLCFEIAQLKGVLRFKYGIICCNNALVCGFYDAWIAGAE
nr:hypothetical protein Itr_chr03CG23240 [Ipomoea trifida]